VPFPECAKAFDRIFTGVVCFEKYANLTATFDFEGRFTSLQINICLLVRKNFCEALP